MFWPPTRGIWKEVAGHGYAFRAYADANGVTARLRKQMKVTNRRKGSEVISKEVIAQSSSKTMRITAATMLSRKGVPIAEIIAMLEHPSEEVTRRYIENYDALNEKNCRRKSEKANLTQNAKVKYRVQGLFWERSGTDMRDGGNTTQQVSTSGARY